MVGQPNLSQDEWFMVLQLLEQERQNLPPEIHHTDSPDLHQQLQARLKAVEDLVTRIKGAVPMPA